jgi:hypothetical protein
LNRNLLRTIGLGSKHKQIAHPARVTPLVIVPSDQLDEVFVELDASGSIKDGRSGVADEISGDNGVFGIFDDALVFAFGSRFDSRLDFVVGCGMLETNDKINDGNIESRYSE